MKLRKTLLIIITVIAIACTQGVPAFAASKENSQIPRIQAEAAIVMDADSGKILYEKDSYTKREPASTTKIVTCMLALEKLDLDQVITVKHDATQMGSIIDVKKGEQLRTEDLLYALMLPSANDAAVALAEEMGGTVEHFCKMMDEKAAECGAKNTHFRNPNGLNWQGQEDHLTTAYDLAVITKEAMKNSTFRKLVSTVRYTIPATNKSKARKLISTNKLIWDDKARELAELKSAENSPGTNKDIELIPAYPGTIGVKTGLTSTAGGCFVGAVDRNGTELISVVLHSGNQDRFTDTVKLWDYVLESYYDTHEIIGAGEAVTKVRVRHGAYRNVQAAAEADASVTVEKGTDLKAVRKEIVKEKLQAPVKKGQKVGTVKIYHGDKLVSQTTLLAAASIDEGGPLSYIGIPDWMAILIYIAAVIILLIILILYLLGRKPGSKRSRRRAAKENEKEEEHRNKYV